MKSGKKQAWKRVKTSCSVGPWLPVWGAPQTSMANTCFQVPWDNPVQAVIFTSNRPEPHRPVHIQVICIAFTVRKTGSTDYTVYTSGCSVISNTHTQTHLFSKNWTQVLSMMNEYSITELQLFLLRYGLSKLSRLYFEIVILPQPTKYKKPCTIMPSFL